MKNHPAMRKLEIDVTYRCGMGCLNCNRLTRLCPGGQQSDMTAEQLESLVRDSVDLRWPWRQWFVLGGEPTEHPGLGELLEVIARYRRQHRPELSVTLCTHGRGTVEIVAQLRRRFSFLGLLDSRKAGPQQPRFVAVCQAPCDQPGWRDWPPPQGCTVSWHCGLGFSYRGLYCCAVGAAIDRVLQVGCQIESLGQLTTAALRSQYRTLCRYCGHLRRAPSRGVEIVSPTWQKALDGRRS